MRRLANQPTNQPNDQPTNHLPHSAPPFTASNIEPPTPGTLASNLPYVATMPEVMTPDNLPRQHLMT